MSFLTADQVSNIVPGWIRGVCVGISVYLFVVVADFYTEEGEMLYLFSKGYLLQNCFP